MTSTKNGFLLMREEPVFNLYSYQFLWFRLSCVFRDKAFSFFTFPFSLFLDLPFQGKFSSADVIPISKYINSIFTFKEDCAFVIPEDIDRQ